MDEFKAEAANQVIEQSRPVGGMAMRLGMSVDSQSAWVRERRKVLSIGQSDASLVAETRRLQAEVCLRTKERDNL